MINPAERCLFTAPFSFIPRIQDAYTRVLPTTFTEVWRRDGVPEDSEVTVWVVNPGQSFVVDSGVLDRLPSLHYLVTPSTGTNHIDLAACEERAVTVQSLLDDRPGLERISASAEFTFMLLLNTLRRLDFGLEEVRARRWRQREDLLRGRELNGKRVGLVGMGRIGRRLLRFCSAFDAEVAFHDPNVPVAGNLTSIPLTSLFEQSEVVCVCCSLNVQTTGMVNADLLRLLPLGASLVNTSRGEVMVQDDLLQVLKERDDLCVGLDVLAGETSGQHLESGLLDLHDKGRIIVTPHIAGATVESQAKAASISLGLIQNHLASILTHGPIG